MNFTISTAQFNKYLNTLSRFISSNSPLVELNGIYLEALENELVMIASDSDISIITVLEKNDEKLNLNIKSQGTALLNAKMLLSIVSKLPAYETEVDVVDGTLTKISSGSATFDISGMDPLSYPTLAFSNTEKSFKLSHNTFSSFMRSVSFAVSSDETRPALTGINLKAENKKLNCVATDSFRLAAKTIELEDDIKFNIIIPARQLDKIYGASEENDVEVFLDNQTATFKFENQTISSRLIDNDYPDISHLLKSEFKYELLVDASELASVVDRASILRYDGKDVVKINILEDKILISAGNEKIGTLKEEMNIISYNGQNLCITSSAKHLLDAIRALNTKQVKLRFNGELSPIILTNPEDDSLLMFVTPFKNAD